ncbi:hypothetical protein cyc_03804 [Cyclospora cayetanensis]|uniref:Secreted protein n=1 Tax=Cyclospora cayetanensis TaxID=88456 RepID=A0A1D3CSG3_9EIME|nr:hypothetical protein cyc_03804 [Cyclospora cayetanensis]
MTSVLLLRYTAVEQLVTTLGVVAAAAEACAGGAASGTTAEGAEQVLCSLPLCQSVPYLVLLPSNPLNGYGIDELVISLSRTNSCI